jgi:catechol 2,3-dioxygenase-like lactoylglutathione lyase family enzyme
MPEVTMKTTGVTLDHMSVSVRRYRDARRMYEAALGAIGMRVNMDVGDACGMGANGEKIFWLSKDREATGGSHVALRVEKRELVDAFHAAAVDAGWHDNGPPGPRPSYGPNYYAAFAKDEEGNNIEVVCYAAPRRVSRRRRTTKAARPVRARPRPR